MDDVIGGGGGGRMAPEPFCDIEEVGGDCGEDEEVGGGGGGGGCRRDIDDILATSPSFRFAVDMFTYAIPNQ